MEHIVPVRAQYAVLLAYCGEGAAALGEMEEISAFYSSLSRERRTEFDNQRALITEILAGRKQLPPPKMATLSGIAASRPTDVDKDSYCPCGSGKKFRNCHGRERKVPNTLPASQNSLPISQIDNEDLQRVYQLYFESIGGREGLLRQMIFKLSMNGQPCDIITRSRQRYINVRIHHNIIAAFMYGLTADTQTPNRVTLLRNGAIVAEVRTRDIWVIHPMPEEGFTEEELRAVDISEGNYRMPNGLTVRQMVRDA